MGWIRFDYLLMFENILEMMMMHACSQTVVLIVAFIAKSGPHHHLKFRVDFVHLINEC